MRFWMRFLAVLVVFILGTDAVLARDVPQGSDELVFGAQLYDKWYAALDEPAPEGNHPIWERQSSNTRSGPDTWRCSECHGWDYKGNQGAYGSGSHATGFPSVFLLSKDMTEADIVAHLKGSKDPSHDFSEYMDDASLGKLATFLKNGLIDDSEYIDPITYKVKNANLENGEKLYGQVCANCHGADGQQIVFRAEGVNETLGAVANRDPFRFLHRTRFGVAGTQMPIGAELGWKVEDGRDVLAYAQTLTTGAENQVSANAGEGSETDPTLGGPPQGLAGGIFTGLAAFFGMFGVSAFFLFGLVALGFLVVWTLRKR
jgi:thiosulfate dehydrogenase